MSCATDLGLNQQMNIRPIIVDCALVTTPDLAAVECIARIQQLARDRGAELRIEHASPGLNALIELCGLRAALGVEVQRQAE